MNIYALLSFVSFLLFFQVGVFTLIKNSRLKTHRIFSLLAFLFSVYAFAYYLFFLTESSDKVYLYDRIAAIGWVFFPLVTSWFSIELTQNKGKGVVSVFYFFLLPAAVFSYYIALTDLESVKTFYFSGSNWYYTPYEQSFPYILFSLYLITSVLLNFFVYIGWYYAAPTNRHKKQALVMLVVLSVFFISSFFTNLILPLIQSDVLPAMAPINALVLVGGGFYVLAKLPGGAITPGAIYSLVIQHVREFLFFLDKEQKLFIVNHYTLSQLKYNQYDILKVPPYELFSDFPKVENAIEKIGSRLHTPQMQMSIMSKDKEAIPVLISVIKVRDYYSNLVGYAIVGIDYRQKLKLKQEVAERIKTERHLYQMRQELEQLVKRRTVELQEANQHLQQEVVERKRAEQQIKSDLEEKIELVQEVHHRVKNNIQMIISLINMLCSHQKIDTEASGRLREIAERVRYISRIHEDFYSSPNLSVINFASYLKSTVGELYRNFGKGSHIVFKLNLSEETLDINQAIPLGIIFNELLINAMKFAFKKHENHKEKEKEVIQIEFYKRDSTFFLSVRDNGAGLPNNFNFKNSSKIGLKLVSILVRDHLRGKIETNSSFGTRFVISFDRSNNT